MNIRVISKCMQGQRFINCCWSCHWSFPGVIKPEWLVSVTKSDNLSWTSDHAIFLRLSNLIFNALRPSICVSKLTIFGSDNGSSPGRRQTITVAYDVILLIRTLGTNISEILSEIHIFSLKKMHMKMSPAKWRPFFLGLNVLNYIRNTYDTANDEILINW